MPRPRARRAAKVAAAAVASVAVVLGATVLIGHHYGANPLPGQKVAHGKTGMETYRLNCAVCHGLNGQGGEGPAFTPGGALAGLTFDQRVARIADGKPLRGMPAWKLQGLSAEEIRMVAAYTQLLSGQEPQPGVEDVR